MKHAYTLVELMIALAIGALLVGLAIPRFTAYQQRLEFEQQARIIQECMQGAAEQAAAPSNLPSGTSKITVTLTHFADISSPTSCSFSSDSVGALTGSANSGSLILCSLNQNSTSSSLNLSYTLPLTKHGGIDLITPPSPTVPSGSPNIFTLRQSDCGTNGLSAIITIPSTGLPVELAITES